MNILNNYNEEIVKYDLINKFNYNKINDIPYFKKIILDFNCKNFEIKKISPAILALELIANKKGVLTKAKKANVLLKIRKGNPVGCSVVIRKSHMFNFFYKIVNDILPILKNFKGIYLKKKNSNNSLTFNLKELIHFSNLEINFYFFENLPSLNVTIVTNTKNLKEFNYLLRSFKIPIN